jgi:hypothetical protein
VNGDPFIYGSFLIGNGDGYVTGYQNFLLNRDLNPSVNDNSPAFVDKVA